MVQIDSSVQADGKVYPKLWWQNQCWQCCKDVMLHIFVPCSNCDVDYNAKRKCTFVLKIQQHTFAIIQHFVCGLQIKNPQPTNVLWSVITPFLIQGPHVTPFYTEVLDSSNSQRVQTGPKHQTITLKETSEVYVSGFPHLSWLCCTLSKVYRINDTESEAS